MPNIKEVDSAVLIGSVAKKLKELKVAKPKYLDYVKTGAGRERVPDNPDFWYIRCASILRQTYLNGPIGISRLRIRYGTRKRHNVHKHHMFRSGGSNIKDAFAALEKLEYVKKGKAGRVVTPKGRSFLDRAAAEILKQGA
ncbi:MAG: 30S ribosomal protein S19e [Candidatus Marsarchaeota archaeon]|nr:30S ribosomal protein S19e [Candidatus Marsarchaeota archaeon]